MNKKAFTLIEAVIIMLLVGLIVVLFTGIVNAKVEKELSDLEDRVNSYYEKVEELQEELDNEK